MFGPSEAGRGQQAALMSAKVQVSPSSAGVEANETNEATFQGPGRDPK